MPYSRYTGNLTRSEVIAGVGTVASIILPLAAGLAWGWVVAAFFTWVILAEAVGLTRDQSPDPVQAFLRRRGFNGLADILNVGPATREELWLLIGSLVVVGLLMLLSVYAVALIFFWVFCVPVALVTTGAMLLSR